MLNKVARLLLKEIKNNAPEARLKKIAKVLYKMAVDASYKDAVIDNFISLFYGLDEELLLNAIQVYSTGLWLSDTDIDKFTTIENKADQNKIQNIKNALKSSQYRMNVEKIGKLANDLIEKNTRIKNFVMPIVRTKMGTIKLLVQNNATRSSVNYTFETTFHFAHRAYLREFSATEIKNAVSELVLAYWSNKSKIKSAISSNNEGYVYTTLKKKTDAGTPVTLVYDFKNPNENQITLITIYPDENNDPTLKDSEFNRGFSIDGYTPPYLLGAKEKAEVKPKIEVKPEVKPIIQLDVNHIEKTKENFLYSIPKNKEPKPRAFSPRWIDGNIPPSESLPEKEKEKYSVLIRNFPSSLTYAVGEENVNRIGQRLCIVLRKWSKEKSFGLKVQIPCKGCRDITTGEPTTPYVYVLLNLKLGLILPANKIPVYDIVNYSFIDAPETQDPKAFWSLRTIQSIPDPPSAIKQARRKLYSPNIW